jgi:prophage regulatory protein
LGKTMQTQNGLPQTGYLRLSQIIGKPATQRAPAIPALIPVCSSTWWNGVRSGRFPAPVKLGERTTAWRVEDVRALIERLAVGIHDLHDEAPLNPNVDADAVGDRVEGRETRS